MSYPASEVETILRRLIDEHRTLLAALDAQQAAMKTLDLKRIEDWAKAQESCRLRIAALESQRRLAVDRIARSMRLAQPPTLKDLAQLDHQRGAQLLTLRDELHALVEQILKRTHIAGKLTGAVLGHLNTAVRLLAGAVERAGVYTKSGAPRVSRRIGMMEAVG